MTVWYIGGEMGGNRCRNERRSDRRGLNERNNIDYKRGRMKSGIEERNNKQNKLRGP
jgi:hypothetical protein